MDGCPSFGAGAVPTELQGERAGWATVSFHRNHKKVLSAPRPGVRGLPSRGQGLLCGCRTDGPPWMSQDREGPHSQEHPDWHPLSAGAACVLGWLGLLQDLIVLAPPQTPALTRGLFPHTLDSPTLHTAHSPSKGLSRATLCPSVCTLSSYLSARHPPGCSPLVCRDLTSFRWLEETVIVSSLPHRT